MRNMEQRSRGGNTERLAIEIVQYFQARAQVIGPGIASVDDTGDEVDRVGDLGGEAAHVAGIDRSGGCGDVDPEGIDARIRQRGQAGSQASVRSRDEDLRMSARPGQGGVGAGCRLGEFLICVLCEVRDECRFIQLDPVDPGRGEDADDVTIDSNEFVEALEGGGGRAGSSLR